MKTSNLIVLLVHALIGWALCGAIMGIGRAVTTLDNTLVIHAIGAPIVFALISWVYFSRFGYTSPLQTALIFVGTVIGMDAFLVAPVFEKSFEMFNSLIGTWIPFGLIFAATYLTGLVCLKQKRMRAYSYTAHGHKLRFFTLRKPQFVTVLSIVGE